MMERITIDQTHTTVFRYSFVQNTQMKEM